MRASWASVAASTSRIVRRGGRVGVAEISWYVATYGRKTRSPGAVDGGLEGGDVLGWRPIGRDRQELERPRDGVVEGGQVVQRCLALGVGHQLEVEWGELEPAAQLAPHPEGVRLDGGRRPGRAAERRRGRPAAHRGER